MLVTGPTGSGKSTTLAAMIDHLNTSPKGHIVTIEDPIEFIHTHRQVRWSRSARSAPTRRASRRRCAPPCARTRTSILVGEMRDLETISARADRGRDRHQVLGTLHTNGAVALRRPHRQRVPAKRQDQVRTMLADSPEARHLAAARAQGRPQGRVVAAEVLVSTHAVSSMIRQGSTHKLSSAIQAGGRVGMQSLDAMLMDLVRREVISGEEAYRALDRPLAVRAVRIDRRRSLGARRRAIDSKEAPRLRGAIGGGRRFGARRFLRRLGAIGRRRSASAARRATPRPPRRPSRRPSRARGRTAPRRAGTDPCRRAATRARQNTSATEMMRAWTGMSGSRRPNGPLPSSFS